MNNFEQEKIKERLWVFRSVDVDGVGVQLSLKGEKWILTISGSKEYIVSLDCINEWSQQKESQSRLNALEEVEKLITEEIMVCHKEGTPTSRLTSLAIKLNDLKL